MQDKDYLENDKEKDTPEGVIHTESTEQEEHDYERFCFLCLPSGEPDREADHPDRWHQCLPGLYAEDDGYDSEWKY